MKPLKIILAIILVIACIIVVVYDAKVKPRVFELELAPVDCPQGFYECQVRDKPFVCDVPGGESYIFNCLENGLSTLVPYNDGDVQ